MGHPAIEDGDCQEDDVVGIPCEVTADSSDKLSGYIQLHLAIFRETIRTSLLREGDAEWWEIYDARNFIRRQGFQHLSIVSEWIGIPNESKYAAWISSLERRWAEIDDLDPGGKLSSVEKTGFTKKLYSEEYVELRDSRSSLNKTFMELINPEDGVRRDPDDLLEALEDLSARVSALKYRAGCIIDIMDDEFGRHKRTWS